VDRVVVIGVDEKFVGLVVGVVEIVEQVVLVVEVIVVVVVGIGILYFGVLAVV